MEHFLSSKHCANAKQWQNLWLVQLFQLLKHFILDVRTSRHSWFDVNTGNPLTRTLSNINSSDIVLCHHTSDSPHFAIESSWSKLTGKTCANSEILHHVKCKTDYLYQTLFCQLFQNVVIIIGFVIQKERLDILLYLTPLPELTLKRQVGLKRCK